MKPFTHCLYMTYRMKLDMNQRVRLLIVASSKSVMRTVVPALVIAMALPAFCHAAEFTGLGDLAGGDFRSIANDISDDGSVVVGNSHDASGEWMAFRWTEQNGMVALGELPGGFVRSRAYGVSADGSVVVGWSSIDGLPGSDFPSTEAFIWTAEHGLVGIGDFGSTETASVANDVSADGNVVVGRGLSEKGDEAFIWTQAEGFTGLGDLKSGRFWGEATSVSADGSIVVGFSEIAGDGSTIIKHSEPSASEVIQAFRWTAESGMEGLGSLLGEDAFSRATQVSGNGKVVVGYGMGSLGTEAFRWTPELGMIGLGAFPDGEFDSRASSVSWDGAIIAGESRAAEGVKAFIWTESAGMRDLRQLLIEQGIEELEHWESLRSPHLSSNGEWVVGYGRNPDGNIEAFRAKVDLDSPGFRINPGLNDAWFNPTTNGQGFLISVFPDLKQMFVAWFTYDVQRPPGNATASLGEPGHRWLTAQGSYQGDTATLTIFMTEGGAFDSPQPAAKTDPAGDGVMILEFADCTQGLLTYEIASLGISGEIPIERIVDDNINLCHQLNGS